MRRGRPGEEIGEEKENERGREREEEELGGGKEGKRERTRRGERGSYVVDVSVAMVPLHIICSHSSSQLGFT